MSRLERVSRWPRVCTSPGLQLERGINAQRDHDTNLRRLGLCSVQGGMTRRSVYTRRVMRTVGMFWAASSRIFGQLRIRGRYCMCTTSGSDKAILQPSRVHRSSCDRIGKPNIRCCSNVDFIVVTHWNLLRLISPWQSAMHRYGSQAKPSHPTAPRALGLS